MGASAYPPKLSLLLRRLLLTLKMMNYTWDKDYLRRTFRS